MVKHLPKEQQRKALFYGILGAYLFRFLAIGLGTFLIGFWEVKALGALYLFYIAYKGLFKGGGEEGETKNKGTSFWRTVLLVELMDIAFSIDSVVAAFGLSNQVWVLFLGGILGVLMMRGVAQVFLKLIARFPELEQSAFLLIALIAGKMLAGAFGYEMPHVIFFTILIAVFVGTILYSSAKRKKKKAVKPDLPDVYVHLFIALQEGGEFTGRVDFGALRVIVICYSMAFACILRKPDAVPERTA